MDGKDILLLRCPFCGGKAKMAPAAFENEDLAHKYADTVGIRCIKCGISTPPLKKEDAVELWNSRYSFTEISD